MDNNAVDITSLAWLNTSSVIAVLAGLVLALINGYVVPGFIYRAKCDEVEQLRRDLHDITNRDKGAQ